MTEDQLVSALLEALARAGWKACHFRPARTAYGWRTAVQGHPGAPDIIAVHPDHGVLLIEAKSDRGALRPEQVEWRSWAEAAAVRFPGAITYRLVRPRDWRDGSLDTLLGYEVAA